jgi:hypothetical protein
MDLPSENRRLRCDRASHASRRDAHTLHSRIRWDAVAEALHRRWRNRQESEALEVRSLAAFGSLAPVVLLMD